MASQVEYPRHVLLSDHRGIYIPQDFVNGFTGWKGVDDEDREILEAGPDHEFYWEAWDNVLANARYVDTDGREWALWQDGDLFTVPADGQEWNADVFSEYFKQREEWNLEYTQSDDYVGEYAYLVGESDRINQSVLRLLTKCSNFYDGPRLLHKQAKLIADDIATLILERDLMEYHVVDEYSSESYGYLDSFPIGEYEDQIDLLELYKEIGDRIECEEGIGGFCDAFQEWAEDQNDFCLRHWRSKPLREDKYPTVEMYTLTGNRIDWVVDESVLTDLVAERICSICRK